MPLIGSRSSGTTHSTYWGLRVNSDDAELGAGRRGLHYDGDDVGRLSRSSLRTSQGGQYPNSRNSGSEAPLRFVAGTSSLTPGSVFSASTRSAGGRAAGGC